MSIHTEGDRTIDMVFDVVEDVLTSTPRPDHRFRLEHCTLMRPDQIERAHGLGVLCNFFINHITHWGVPIEDALFDSERAAGYVPAGSTARSGMRISLRADAPMTDPSCLALMAAATTRRAPYGRCVGPAERLGTHAALEAVTIDTAFQIGMESRLGSLTPDKHADLVILDRNPLEIGHDAPLPVQDPALVPPAVGEHKELRGDGCAPGMWSITMPVRPQTALRARSISGRSASVASRSSWPM